MHIDEAAQDIDLDALSHSKVILLDARDRQLSLDNLDKLRLPLVFPGKLQDRFRHGRREE